MTTEAQPQVVRSFLDQLETALIGVPGDIGREIVAGITEELAGLDAATAAARIEELGDPAFIAAEARAGVPPVAAVSAVPAQAPVLVSAVVGEPRWYAVLTALLVAFGGYVVPVLGWIVGIVMMWLSKSWFRWEKWVATLGPVVLVALPLLGVVIANSFGGLTGWHFLVLSVLAIPAIVGLWLLWRLSRHPRPMERKGL